MDLWEAFCARFGGKPAKLQVTENGVEPIEDPFRRQFRFTVTLGIHRDMFERDPMRTVEYMQEVIEQAAKRAGKEMRAELIKMRSTGQNSVVN